MSGRRSHRRHAVPALATRLAWLADPGVYPDHPVRVATIETHLSFVFLTDRFVYKLKKPVRHEYLDFRTLAARRRNGAAEVRLNRRLAPGVHLGVVPLTVDARGRARVGGKSRPVEWLVRMRRLPAARMLDRLIRDGRLRSEDVRRLAARLAAFYARRPAVHRSGARYRREYIAAVRANRAALLDPRLDLPRRRIEMLHAAQLAFIARHGALFESRARTGRIVEGHGDLRPEHVCLESPPVIFDCLEFNRRFRVLDVADELAFFSMECERLGAPQVGAACMRACVRATGDRPPEQLIAFYKAYRACVRARLAIWHLRDRPPAEWPRWRRRAEEYLVLAGRYTAALCD